MAIGHDPFLVVLSVLIAVQASYVSLSLSSNVETSFGLQRRLLLGGAALSLAIGIWGMHFVTTAYCSRLCRLADTCFAIYLRAGRWIRDFHRKCAAKNG